MKIEELQQYDWVEAQYVSDDGEPYPSPMQVMRVIEAEGRLLLRRRFGARCRYYDIAEVSPIPLSRKILVRNGFSSRGISLWANCEKLQRDKGCIVEGRGTKPPVEWYFSPRHAEWEEQVKYVHQLQRLLRRVGDNSRISL